MRKTASKKKKERFGIMAFLKFIALILPLSIYVLLITCVFAPPNSGFIATSIIGCFAIGLSLVNLVGLLDDMYLGHIVTASLAALGAVLVAVSSVVIYVPAIYTQLNEQHISFYFLVWAILGVLAVYYLLFRYAVGLFLQNDGMSKTAVKKSLKGSANFWWYQAHKERQGFAWIYHINKLFTILFPLVGIVHGLVGWLKIVFPFVTAMICVLALLSLCMYYVVFATWDVVKSSPRKASKAKMSIGFVFPFMALAAIVLYLIQIW